MTLVFYRCHITLSNSHSIITIKDLGIIKSKFYWINNATFSLQSMLSGTTPTGWISSTCIGIREDLGLYPVRLLRNSSLVKSANLLTVRVLLRSPRACSALCFWINFRLLMNTFFLLSCCILRISNYSSTAKNHFCPRNTKGDLPLPLNGRNSSHTSA